MEFDFMIIGAGVAGIALAKGLKRAGKNVCIVENNFYGGVVYNYGSNRKKMFSEVAKNQSFNKKLEKLGIVKKTGYNWKETAQWINQSESFENNQNEKMLVELDITIKYGKAQLVDANTVSVDGILYNTNSIILAFGAKDRPFDFEGSAYMNDSRDFLMQADLPENIVLYGAGIISFAFQNIAQSFGSHVTVLQHDDIALRNFDDLLVQRLIEKIKTRS